MGHFSDASAVTCMQAAKKSSRFETSTLLRTYSASISLLIHVLTILSSGNENVWGSEATSPCEPTCMLNSNSINGAC
ncbi:hypothetical protein KC357_g196 [Hortaea werneckii]|nr:hypothetical protein KC357_g196 [Hortaea werneckii]